MGVTLRYLGHASFEILLPSKKVLIIDPCIQYGPTAPLSIEDVTGADYIAVSEDSYAAVADVGVLGRKFNSKVICSYRVGEALHGRPFEEGFFNLDHANVIKVAPGNVIEFPDLRVEVKKAEHISLLESFRVQYKLEHGQAPDPKMTVAQLRKHVIPMTTTDLPEKKEKMKKVAETGLDHKGEQLNFVFQTQDNLRIYFYSAGTYDFLIPELKSGHPNILIAQLSGNDPEKIAEFAALSGAEVVIPSHHDMRGPKKEKQMADAMANRLAEIAPRVQFISLTRGKWYDIGVQISPVHDTTR